MAFKTNDYQQITLSDSYINLSPRTRMAVALKIGAYNFGKLLKHNRNTRDNCALQEAFC